MSTLREAADLFHEILSALEAKRLLDENRPLTAPVRENLEAKANRDPAKLAASGFELCVRALTTPSDPNVTIHACGVEAFGEQP